MSDELQTVGIPHRRIRRLIEQDENGDDKPVQTIVEPSYNPNTSAPGEITENDIRREHLVEPDARYRPTRNVVPCDIQVGEE